MAIKSMIVLLCVVVAVLSEKYTDKYDNINLEEILANKKLLQAYADCTLDKGKCTPEGKEMKDHLQEAIETGCEKCTETQENKSFVVIKHLIEFHPKIWDEMCAKFDPEGKWRKTYEDRAKAHGIEIPH